MRRIVNTAKEEVRPDWLFGGNPEAIAAQEARGQEQLAESAVLPVAIWSGDITTLKKAGVKFGKPLPNDSIFCEAELPLGWKKQPTDHSMWTDLVDAEGQVRAQIFYKAAFYDRDAGMHVKDVTH